MFKFGVSLDGTSFDSGVSITVFVSMIAFVSVTTIGFLVPLPPPPPLFFLITGAGSFST